MTLLDATGHVLPFSYSYAGDQMVTPHPPARVDLAPGGIAFVTINTYRCDLGGQVLASSIQLVPPGDVAALQTPVLASSFALGYCGMGDPGSSVSVSPVSPTYSETVAH